MWTTVHREISPWDAHIVAGRLQAEGLNTCVLFDNIVRIDWSQSLSYGGVHVQVPDAELAHARQVLCALANGDYEADLAAELALPGDVRCPRCGSYRWRWRRGGYSSAFAVLCAAWGAIFAPQLTGRRCGSCGLRQTLAEMDEGSPR